MSTVHHVHAALNKLLNDAERKGLVTRNVARLATAPSLTAARARAPEMTVWTPGELARFLESIDGNRNEAMFRLARADRHATRRARRPSLVRRRPRPPPTDREPGGRPSSTASRWSASRRPAAAAAWSTSTPSTVETLQRHRSRQREQHLALGVTATASDRVFTSDLGEPLRPDSVGQAFRRLVLQADVPVIRLHDLRHTHARHLLWPA